MQTPPTPRPPADPRQRLFLLAGIAAAVAVIVVLLFVYRGSGGPAAAPGAPRISQPVGPAPTLTQPPWAQQTPASYAQATTVTKWDVSVTVNSSDPAILQTNSCQAKLTHTPGDPIGGVRVYSCPQATSTLPYCQELSVGGSPPPSNSGYKALNQAVFQSGPFSLVHLDPVPQTGTSTVELETDCPATVQVAGAGGGGGTTGVNRPSVYSQFTTVSDAATLKTKLQGTTTDWIYLTPGSYTVANPIVIQRSGTLYFHGIDRFNTKLIAADPTQPIFKVTGAALINIASIRFQGVDGLPTQQRAILFAQTSSLIFEMLDGAGDHMCFEAAGPGRYIFQGDWIVPGPYEDCSILVNHPQADVYVQGGDWSNGSEGYTGTPANPNFPGLYTTLVDQAKVWQKQGRLRVLGLADEAILGSAAYRIETASTLGPHEIIRDRSEGYNGYGKATGPVSRLLYVPPGASGVQVAIINSAGGFQTGPNVPPAPSGAWNNCELVNWNASSGTLWLIGNIIGSCGKYVVAGSLGSSIIVTAGNYSTALPPNQFNVTGGTLDSGSDITQYNLATSTDGTYAGGDGTPPVVRYAPSTNVALSSYSGLPQFPNDTTVPHALPRPRMDAALSGMIDVKASYAAKGDGVTDDTTALQTALNAACNSGVPKIYFPAGIYKISATLGLNSKTAGTCGATTNGMGYGGIIAGAGSQNTTIQMVAGTKLGTFESDGMAMATIQGISFRTWKWAAADPLLGNVDVEFQPGYNASQIDNFYDVVFDGGYAGFATGMGDAAGNTGGNCSSMNVYGSTLQNAHLAFLSGHYNAILNGCIDCVITNSDFAFGAETKNEGPNPPGGDWYIVHGSASNLASGEGSYRGTTVSSGYLYYDYQSTTPLIFSQGSTTAFWPITYWNATLTPVAGITNVVVANTGGGPIFLYSSVSRTGIQVGNSSGGTAAGAFVFKLGSSIPDWASATVYANGWIDAVW